MMRSYPPYKSYADTLAMAQASNQSIAKTFMVKAHGGETNDRRETKERCFPTRVVNLPGWRALCRVFVLSQDVSGQGFPGQLYPTRLGDNDLHAM